MNNLKTVNDRAGGDPVEVDRRIIDLLLFCRELEQLTSGRVDVTMGSVLALWHDARSEGVDDPEHAALPDAGALEEAAKHTGFHLLEIDEARRPPSASPTPWPGWTWAPWPRATP